MPTLIKRDRLPDIKLPELDRLKAELSDVDLSKVEVPKVDLSDIEVPKVDVGKAIAGAAAAVGLAKLRRSRWPFVIVGGIAVAVAGWALLNAEAILERIGRAKGWIDDRMATGTEDELDEPVAFTAEPTAPFDQPPLDEPSVPVTTGADYAEGLGASSGSRATNGRGVPAGSR